MTNETGQAAADKSLDTPASKFRVGRVLFLVGPLALVLIGVAAFLSYGGPEWWAKMTAPGMGPVEGQVFYNGEPLGGAVVTSKPVKPGLRGGIGVADASGRFQMSTDVNGTFIEGAYLGEQKITVGFFGPSPGLGAPPLLTPKEYASFDEKPLTIVVAPAAEAKPFEFKLKGPPLVIPAPKEKPGPPKAKFRPAPEGDNAAPAGGNNASEESAPAGASEANETPPAESSTEGPPSP